MQFYTKTHQHYCGIDLHSRNMYVCIVDREGNILFHRSLKARPEQLLRASGRGLYLIRTFMDEVTINDVGNRIRMVADLDRPDGEGDDGG